jgi:Fe-S cluster assembly protein SufD
MSTPELIGESKLSSFTTGLTPASFSINEDALRSAKETLNRNDFPSTRNEAWKYTRVGRIANLKLQTRHVGTLHLDRSYLISNVAVTLIFENGSFLPSLSTTMLPEGVRVVPFGMADAALMARVGSLVKTEGDVFSSLNTNYMGEGVIIVIGKNCKIDKPIQLIHVLSGNHQMASPRILVIAEKFSQANLASAFYSANAEGSFVNAITEVIVEEGAHLSIDELQYESEGNFHVQTEQVYQEKDSTFTINTITLNGTFVRNNLNIVVDGVNCTTNLNGAYLLKGNQHVDNHTMVDHRMPHCQSNELYKGVIDENATGVFNGKVFVRKDAQKINAFQSNGNVLLSDNATINSKPELEIYADDVKCSHGSTTGQLDENAVFYLRARGLSERSARNLLVSAFIEDVLSNIQNEDMLHKVHAILKERYGWELE